MNNKERLALLELALDELRLTEDGFTRNASAGHWRRAMGALKSVEADLKAKPKMPKPTGKVPNLGPVWRGGTSLLDQDLTHMSDGVETNGVETYPALDDAYVGGRTVIAPEALKVTKSSSSHPGDAFYAEGASGLEYWFAHLVYAPGVGRTFRKGEAMGTVLSTSIGGGSHTHVGINIEKLVGRGKMLAHHTDYTHGAEKIGSQLKRLLG